MILFREIPYQYREWLEPEPAEPSRVIPTPLFWDRSGAASARYLDDWDRYREDVAAWRRKRDDLTKVNPTWPTSASINPTWPA